jgi:DNA-binding response OmpR family regulator
MRVKPHILFVDDEAPIRELLALYFRKRGYEVTTAVCSADALKLVAEGVFQLAVLDVDIAGENGLELLTALKARNGTLPVIMFTGMKTDEDLLAKSLARGADGFMRKTDSLHDLFGEVQRFVPAPAP